MEFDAVWKTLLIPGEYDDMDDCDKSRWRGVVESAFNLGKETEREAERLYCRHPNLSPVIAWLENGCDPKEAVKELRIYQHMVRDDRRAGVEHMKQQQAETEAHGGQPRSTVGLRLHYDTRREIERLAADAHDTRTRYEARGMMNTPSDPVARKAAAIEYALARREFLEADLALENALRA